MKDKRDECGCHRSCSVFPHVCEVPCVFPDCLTKAEHDELMTELRRESES